MSASGGQCSPKRRPEPDAARQGPAAANRAGLPDFQAHLLGRIAWLEQLNPARGRKLRARFAQIDWDEAV